MNFFAHGRYAILEHTVCGRIGDHDRRDLVLIGGNFGVQIIEIDIPMFIALNHNHSHVRHLSTGGIGAVSTAGDQTDISVVVSTRFVILFDRQ